MGDIARTMAYHIVAVFLFFTAIGSVLPESGNILARRIGIRAHSFNILFLALGVIGISVALYLGYRASSTGS